MPLSYNHSPNRKHKIAVGNEEPNIRFSMGLGKPTSPALYEGVPLN